VNNQNAKIESSLSNSLSSCIICPFSHKPRPPYICWSSLISYSSSTSNHFKLSSDEIWIPYVSKLLYVFFLLIIFYRSYEESSPMAGLNWLKLIDDVLTCLVISWLEIVFLSKGRVSEMQLKGFLDFDFVSKLNFLESWCEVNVRKNAR
jgi:hypothetical protein